MRESSKAIGQLTAEATYHRAPLRGGRTLYNIPPDHAKHRIFLKCFRFVSKKDKMGGLGHLPAKNWPATGGKEIRIGFDAERLPVRHGPKKGWEIRT